MGTKVILNVYDLSPANNFLHPVGFGLHHSGVEISGSEYSFGGGGGIFENTPKEANGAKFRESIDMGSYDGGSSELQRCISDLRDEFGPDSYNLVQRNCNHFANALCWALLRKTLPGHVNRLADFGNCCSCILPKEMLEAAPVNGGGGGGGGGGGFQMQGGSGRAQATTGPSSVKAFAGGGAKLGSSSNTSTAQATFSSLSNVRSLVGGMTMTKKKDVGDDLIDRREKARKAALARFDQNNNSINTTTQHPSNGSSSPLLRDADKSKGGLKSS